MHNIPQACFKVFMARHHTTKLGSPCVPTVEGIRISHATHKYPELSKETRVLALFPGVYLPCANSSTCNNR
jgi:hypothetical protein